jgi:hypothetical protein
MPIKKNITLACHKLADTRPKCAKCRGGHKIDNCGLKCSFYLGLGHMEERCWKKTTKENNHELVYERLLLFVDFLLTLFHMA